MPVFKKLHLLLIPVIFALVVLATATQPLKGEDLSGYWTGRWYSCQSGHRGVLRAQFCRLDDSYYQVRFSGRFFKVMPFRYSVVLRAEDYGDHVRLYGSSYLGRLVGTFSYEATVVGDQFESQYWSAKDNGWFELQRCR